MIEEKLYWHKFRPNTIEDKGIKMILLPRIKKVVESGITMNLLFYGSPGLGKTTLANILTKDTDCLRINCRIDKLENIRTKAEEHCTKYGVFGSTKKIIWLEEFDGASWQMRETLRPLIEMYIDHVKFIATANSISNFTSEADTAVLSRFNKIKFDPITDKEKQYLKKNQKQFLKGISKKVNYEVEDEIIEKLIDSNFPDFRSSVQDLQQLVITDDKESWENPDFIKNVELYSYLLDGKNNVDDNYFYVMENFKDNTSSLLSQLGRPFFSFLLENHKDKIKQNGKELIKIQKTYNSEYSNAYDPEIHLISMITEIKEKIN